MSKSVKIRVLSGIRASHSSLHIGNLLGAIEGMVALQNDPKYETFYMVADLHGITTPFNPKELNKNRLEVAKDYLAAGIDPDKSTLFLQSDLTEHPELAYYLSSTIRVPRVLRVPSFEKRRSVSELQDISVARLDYPILMAADILLYKAEKVPIGLDQEPHLEIAREIARTVNRKYGTDLPIPRRFSVTAENFVIPNLKGNGKMAKSEPEYAIFLNDSLDVIKTKLAGVPTDSGKGSQIPEEGGVYTLLVFAELFIGVSRRKELEKLYITTGIKYKDLKVEIAVAIFNRVKLIQEKRKFFDQNPKIVDQILDNGAKKARLIARNTLNEIKGAMGLLHNSDRVDYQTL